MLRLWPGPKRYCAGAMTIRSECYIVLPDFPQFPKQAPETGCWICVRPGRRAKQVEVLLKFPRLFVCAVLFAAFSALLPAEQPSTGYHRVACIKVKPENNSEFRKWAAGDLHKITQSRVDDGAVSQWILLRSVIPSGTSAECDYVVVTMYPRVPPQPMDLDELDAALKKAGMSMTAQRFVDRRNS